MLLGWERRSITQNSLFIVLSWGRILVLQFCAQVAPGFLCNLSAVHPRIACRDFRRFGPPNLALRAWLGSGEFLVGMANILAF